MIRKIIRIDETRCNGCGACAAACHEGAIQMIAGKAKLIRDDYCDGLGNCLPVCPTDAISFEEREAAAYDEAAVKARQEEASASRGCPGEQAHTITRETSETAAGLSEVPSQLRQWPVQIKLAPLHAPYFEDADLLIAADCTAYACGDFHNRFLRGRIVLIGCPKLDEGSYAEKLTEIFRQNEIRSVTVVRMEVPCCGGIEYAVQEALQASRKGIPCQVVTLSTEGRILSQE